MSNLCNFTYPEFVSLFHVCAIGVRLNNVGRGRHGRYVAEDYYTKEPSTLIRKLIETLEYRGNNTTYFFLGKNKYVTRKIHNSQVSQ